MKTIHRRAITLSLCLAVLFLIMGSAAADPIEIREPFGPGPILTVDASNFATFYYSITDDGTTEIDMDVITEALYIEDI